MIPIKSFFKVGCLLGKFCKVYDIKPSKIVTEILAVADGEPKPGMEATNMVSTVVIAMPVYLLHIGCQLTIPVNC